MPLSRDTKLEAYEALIAEIEDLERKGKTQPYTSLNGNMFSFLAPDGTLAFRLSKADRAAFLDRFPDAVVEQYDTAMKDYVAVPDALIEDASPLRELFASCLANARTLKPKPTTRKRKQAS